MQAEHAVNDWLNLNQAFNRFFAPYGTVIVAEDAISFSADASKVSTSFTVFSDGRFAATMPLHEVDAKADRLIFNETSNSLRCEGPFGEYTYRIPQQLIGA